MFTLKTTFTGHSSAVYALSRGRHDEVFFSAGGDGYIAEWEVETGKQTRFAVNTGNTLFSILYIREFDLLLAGSSTGNIHVIDLTSKKESRNLALHHNGMYQMIFCPQRSLLLCAGGDGLLSAWTVPDFEMVRNIPLTSMKIRKLAPDREEKLLAVACGDGSVLVLEMEYFNEVHRIEAHNDGAGAVSWHPSKPILVSGGKDGMIRCWNKNDGFKEVLAFAAHRSAVYSISFDPAGQLCATAGRDKTIKIWRSDSFDSVQRLDHQDGGHTHSVNDLLWLEKTLISAGDDRKVISWSIN